VWDAHVCVGSCLCRDRSQGCPTDDAEPTYDDARVVETRASSWARALRQAVTSTVTGTPLVRTSNTAEWVRDCSTIAFSVSAGASPSTVKWMEICS
jgi:hypothetical protein